MSLAISREKKQELVKSYAEEFSRSQAAILTDYRGLPVTELWVITSIARKKGCFL